MEIKRTSVPSNLGIGGSRDYPTWQCHRALHVLVLHNDYDMDVTFIGCSLILFKRWFNQSQPYRRTGEVQKNSICGYDQLLLAMYLYIYSTISSDEIASFILTNGGVIYTRKDISSRCNEM